MCLRAFADRPAGPDSHSAPATPAMFADERRLPRQRGNIRPGTCARRRLAESREACRTGPHGPSLLAARSGSGYYAKAASWDYRPVPILPFPFDSRALSVHPLLFGVRARSCHTLWRSSRLPADHLAAPALPTPLRSRIRPCSHNPELARAHTATPHAAFRKIGRFPWKTTSVY